MSITEREVRELVSRVLTQYQGMVPQKAAPGGGQEFPVEASARHVHLTREAVEALPGVDGHRAEGELAEGFVAVRNAVTAPAPASPKSGISPSRGSSSARSGCGW